MSNIYSTEPRTTGIVNLNTSYGPLRIELWGKECPLACKNFIQLCLEGYYDQSPFHRLVPGFCLQGGKPAQCPPEDEKEGSSIFPGGRFPIETHSRLNFNRRGLLGMVVSNPNDSNSSNGSQFFFTLSEASELNGRATLFGRLVNDTIFNLLRMAELEIDPNTEAPLYPPKIINTEIISNPFNDIIPRVRPAVSNEPQVSLEQPNHITSRLNINKSNRALLSFDDDESESINARPKCPELFLSSAPQPSTQISLSSTSSATSSLQFLQQMKSVQMRDTQAKIKKIEEELGYKTVENKSTDSTIEQKEVKKNISALEKYKTKFKDHKRRKDAIETKDEIDTLLILNSFRQKIQKTEMASEKIQPQNDNKPPSKKHLDICRLHGLLDCLSCRDTFNIGLGTTESENITEKDWMIHKLVFDRRELDGQVREDLKDLVVIDPREQQAQLSNKNKTDCKNDKIK